MRTLKFITSHVTYNPAYTYKFQLKTTDVSAKKHYALKVGKKNIIMGFVTSLFGFLDDNSNLIQTWRLKVTMPFLGFSLWTKVGGNVHPCPLKGGGWMKIGYKLVHVKVS